jgi:hypothetical protein
VYQLPANPAGFREKLGNVWAADLFLGDRLVFLEAFSRSTTKLLFFSLRLQNFQGKESRMSKNEVKQSQVCIQKSSD